MHSEVSRCPACRGPLEATELTCPECQLQLRGRFGRGCRFCTLDPEQRRLLDIFLSCRGVLRDMEKVLGLSYPTVRARVDALLAALGYAPTKAELEAEQDQTVRRREILARLEAGEITAEEAASAIREISG